MPERFLHPFPKVDRILLVVETATLTGCDITTRLPDSITALASAARLASAAFPVAQLAEFGKADWSAPGCCGGGASPSSNTHHASRAAAVAHLPCLHDHRRREGASRPRRPLCR